MPNIIKHIHEPQTLLLVWQPPEGTSRVRCIVGELVKDDLSGIVTLKYLKETEDFRKACELGFEGYPAFKNVNKEYANGVVDAFLRRLPPRSRGDFSHYLEQLRLDVKSKFSDFALLGYSGAKLPSDGFSIINPFYDVIGPCEFVTEVAGFRYRDISINDVNVGDEVTLEPEPNNEYDPNAIKVMLGASHIGYVNRGQLKAFHGWLASSNVSACVERINGREDRPLIYLYVQIPSNDLDKGMRVAGAGG